MSKLPGYGGTGPRSSRFHGGAYAHPFESRASMAKSMYDGGGPLGPGHPQIADNAPSAPTPSAPSANPSQNPAASSSGAAATPPPDFSQFDLNADPVYQQVQASIARANADAGAQALTAREQALENYGDPALAASVLGANDPFVQAAGANQESTVALLKRAYDQNLSNYDNNLDPSLLQSGARIKGEGLLGQNYQDEKYRAAQAIRAALSGIDTAYTNQLEGNQNTLDTALGDAYARAVQNALTNPPATGGDSGTSTSSSTPPKTGSKPKPKPKPKARLARAAARPIRQSH